MRIGIFGSAFDPVTNGHLWAAKTAMRCMELDKVIFVPSSDQRGDKNRKLSSNIHRLNMVNLAIKNQRGFEANDIEMNSPADKQFTYYTMEHFKENPNDEIFFIMGADNLIDIKRWCRYEELVERNKFIVLSRNCYDMQEIIKENSILSRFRENFYLINRGYGLDISSSFIRHEFENGNNPNEFLPMRCYDYIIENRLYLLKNKGGYDIMKTLQMEIIEKLKVSPSINAKVEIRKRIDFLKDYLKANPSIQSLVLGLSGGQDSTLCGKLSQMAVNELNEELGEKKYKFIGVRLPYGIQKDEDDCKLAIDFIQPDVVFTVNIKTAVDASVKTLNDALGIELSDFLKGNEKARERMKVQYSIAGNYCGLVVGSDHASEAIMGFFTKFGDGAADILPISNLNKRQGRQMLVELGCPQIIYTKAPTADLEDMKPQLPDEAAYGVTYEEIDDYLEGKRIDENSRKIIEGTYIKTQHKRNAAVTMFDRF